MTRMTKVDKQLFPRVCQGDILRDIAYIEYVSEQDGIVEISEIVFPLVVVLTQDCDLEQDYNSRKDENNSSTQDKWLLSVLVAPLYNAEHIYAGVHLSDLGIKSQTINKGKTPGDNLRKNETPRYHFLEFPDDVPIVPSVIDFKHYFSVNVQHIQEMKQTSFVCSVSALFREDISQRFTSFLARIGLPEIKTTS